MNIIEAFFAWIDSLFACPARSVPQAPPPTPDPVYSAPDPIAPPVLPVHTIPAPPTSTGSSLGTAAALMSIGSTFTQRPRHRAPWEPPAAPAPPPQKRTQPAAPAPPPQKRTQPAAPPSSEGPTGDPLGDIEDLIDDAFSSEGGSGGSFTNPFGDGGIDFSGDDGSPLGDSDNDDVVEGLGGAAGDIIDFIGALFGGKIKLRPPSVEEPPPHTPRIKVKTISGEIGATLSGPNVDVKVRKRGDASWSDVMHPSAGVCTFCGLDVGTYDVVANNKLSERMGQGSVNTKYNVVKNITVQMYRY